MNINHPIKMGNYYSSLKKYKCCRKVFNQSLDYPYIKEFNVGYHGNDDQCVTIIFFELEDSKNNLMIGVTTEISKLEIYCDVNFHKEAIPHHILLKPEVLEAYQIVKRLDNSYEKDTILGIDDHYSQEWGMYRDLVDLIPIDKETEEEIKSRESYVGWYNEYETTNKITSIKIIIPKNLDKETSEKVMSYLDRIIDYSK